MTGLNKSQMREIHFGSHDHENVPGSPLSGDCQMTIKSYFLSN